MKQVKSAVVSRSLAAAELPGTRAPARQPIEDRRPRVAAQRRLRAVADASPRVQHLKALQAMANPVAQLNGDSNESYAAHKEAGGGDSKWDGADDKKQKIWEELERDAYQHDTAELLGATGKEAIPTTNHVLAKGRVPQFEFSLANLRFGPNGGLRADDPDQRPDYNIGDDGALTPRSRRIATLFESGDKQKLRDAMRDLPGRRHEPKDLDQWYITRAEWDRIAADWDQRDSYWTEHSVPYFSVDYTKKTSDGHKSSVVQGLPWIATREIPITERARFKGLKNFISRGGPVRNPEQKKIVAMFQTLREQGTPPAKLVEPMGLGEALEALMPLSQDEVDAAFRRLIDNVERSLQPQLDELRAFSVKVAEPAAALDLLIARIRVEAKSEVERSWHASMEGRFSSRRTSVMHKLGERYLTFLAGEEGKWVREFQGDKEEREPPYHMEGQERADFVTAMAQLDLTGALASSEKRPYTEAPPLVDEDFTTVLKGFETRLAELKREQGIKIEAWLREGTKTSFEVAHIRRRMEAYGFQPNKKLRVQPTVSAGLADFIAEANLWLGASIWVTQFGDKKAPEAASKDLHTLVTGLRNKYQ